MIPLTLVCIGRALFSGSIVWLWMRCWKRDAAHWRKTSGGWQAIAESRGMRLARMRNSRSTAVSRGNRTRAANARAVRDAMTARLREGV